jgi:hypothetical protein
VFLGGELKMFPSSYWNGSRMGARLRREIGELKPMLSLGTSETITTSNLSSGGWKASMSPRMPQDYGGYAPTSCHAASRAQQAIL